ncbi:MAG: aspartate aminotransferase family protein [Saprospiraceae bacterium]|nr:aspartate aminotransferase family protein [Saprospiraceae bacterium]
MNKRNEETHSRMKFPRKGKAREGILQHLRERAHDDADWKGGRTWSLVYHLDEQHQQLLMDAYALYAAENRLNPLTFPSLKVLEDELVSMTADLLNGDPNTVGTITAGGTESLFLMLFAYRERARIKMSPRKKAGIVIPSTMHPAVEKAAHILGLRVRKIPVSGNYQADAEAMEKAIDRNTIMIAASAPSYPHGIIDPIAKLAEIARRCDIPFHVDACVGGFMLPWIERLDNRVPVWDFRLEGVTSISADIHKHGFGAKGVSALLYRDMSYLRHQFYVTADFPGGVYATSSLLGTRSGGPLATAWAAIQSLGAEGYLRWADRIMDGVEQIKAGLESIPEIEILGKPVMNLLAYRTRNNRPDIFVVAQQLEKKGWNVDRQQLPACIHLSVLPTNLPVIDQYLSDLEQAVTYALKNPGASGEGEAAVYGLLSRMPMRGTVEKEIRNAFEDLHNPDRIKHGKQADNFPVWMKRLNHLWVKLERLWSTYT